MKENYLSTLTDCEWVVVEELYPVKNLMEQFNRSNFKVRVLAILSPTCPDCLHGFEMLKTLLHKFPSDDLSVFLIWIPMLDEDNFEAAIARSRELSDSRLTQAWDYSRQIGTLFGKTLNLQKTAWDVYLIYARTESNWEGDEIQSPTFWMHQLSSDPGADSSLSLNNEVFFRRLSDLL
jgi:hypothetical protein